MSRVNIGGMNSVASDIWMQKAEGSIFVEMIRRTNNEQCRHVSAMLSTLPAGDNGRKYRPAVMKR